MEKRIFWTIVIAAIAVLVVPDFAFAANAGGGGMPYSGYMNTFKTSVTGEIAALVCVIAIIAGVATYIFASHFDGILLTIMRVIIGVAIVGSATTFAAAAGAQGALI